MSPQSPSTVGISSPVFSVERALCRRYACSAERMHGQSLRFLSANCRIRGTGCNNPTARWQSIITVVVATPTRWLTGNVFKSDTPYASANIFRNMNNDLDVIAPFITATAGGDCPNMPKLGVQNRNRRGCDEFGSRSKEPAIASPPTTLHTTTYTARQDVFFNVE